MQSNTRPDAPPDPEANLGEGVLFVDFKTDLAEFLVLLNWCQGTADRLGMPCAVQLGLDADYSPPQPVTVALYPSHSMTVKSVRELTSLVLTSLRRSLKFSQTWQPAVSWAPSPLDRPEFQVHPHS